MVLSGQGLAPFDGSTSESESIGGGFAFIHYFQEVSSIDQVTSCVLREDRSSLCGKPVR